MRASVLRRFVGSCVVCSSVALVGCPSPPEFSPDTEVRLPTLTEAGTDRATFSVQVFRYGGERPAITTGVCVGIGGVPMGAVSGICGEVPAPSSRETFTTAVTVSGLTPDTEYSARAFLMYEGSPEWSAQLTFRTLALTPPAVSTGAVSGVTATGAAVAGSVTAAGNSAVTERGVCYATSPTPVRSGSCVVAGTGAGTFSATLTGLTPSTVYYARAFATNGAGTVYGSDIEFTTLPLVQPSFTLAAETTSQLVERGKTGAPVALSVTRQGSFTGAVTVTVTGLPSGVTANVESPGTSEAGSVAFDVSEQATTGTFNLELVGSASGLASQSLPFSLTVADMAGLSLSAPEKLDMTQGGSSSATIGIVRTGGWTGTVTLELHGLPSGITGSFSPASTTGNVTMLNLAVDASVPAGSSYPIEVRATGDIGVTATATITINVS